jgi:hypothetical protein
MEVDNRCLGRPGLPQAEVVSMVGIDASVVIDEEAVIIKAVPIWILSWSASVLSSQVAKSKP